MIRYFKIFLVFLIFFSGCKKSTVVPSNIIDSSIDINNEETEIDEISVGGIFSPNSQYRAYFSSAATSVNGQYFFIGTRSANDGDFTYSDLVINKTNKGFDEIFEKRLFIMNSAGLNSVTPSLIHVGDALQFYYLRQESFSDAQIYMTESLDGGETWSNERKISFQAGFNGIINDRVVYLSSGRIIIPVAFTNNIDKGYNKQYVFCYYSDDKGLNWYKSKDIISNIPLMEPCVAETSNGQLLMVIRSKLGKLLFSRSSDNGGTWSIMEKSHLNSPSSTSAIYKIDNGVLALIWNNTAPYSHVFDRKPLSLSISKDQGKTWSIPYKIGNEPDEIYSSPGLFKSDANWVIHFNHSKNAADYGIRAKKINIKY